MTDNVGTGPITKSETTDPVVTTSSVASTTMVPTDRDVIISETTPTHLHRGNMLLLDLIKLHYNLSPNAKEWSKESKDVEKLASNLFHLMSNGKKFELAGLKDVPKPFLKGKGRFLEMKEMKKDGAAGAQQGWRQLTEEEAKAYITKTVMENFQLLSSTALVAQPDDAIKGAIKDHIGLLLLKKGKDNPGKAEEVVRHSAPRPCDVLFLPCGYPTEENMPYEHQSGNKHLLFLASQNVAADTNDSTKRLAAALKLVTSKVEISTGTEVIQKNPRYVLQLIVDNQNSWRDMDQIDLAEFAVIFVFEVYLEKQIHGMAAASVAIGTAHNPDSANPSDIPIETPTAHDVLFGRGGMTNGHPGNRRFRDIIALHRPDYIRATKMDKPNVARRIVKAIRQGNPPGRFLKKSEDGRWYDVGDRCAAEKTSQGLRERSNAEKRQRSALREALRIRREDLAENAEESPANKKAKLPDPSGMGHLGANMVRGPYMGVAPQLNYAGAIPLSLSMKEKPKEARSKKSKAKDIKDEAGAEAGASTESLPPNAVDKDGNILVTDYDILCGRGGLTNHHKGNKRFRDIVALHRPDYVRAPKIQKPSVARVIVRAIRNGDPPGRFLKKDEKLGKWYDIGDKRAAEKTSQALREKTNEERDRATVTPPFTSPTVYLPTATTGGLPAVGTALTGSQVAGASALPTPSKGNVDVKTENGSKDGKTKTTVLSGKDVGKAGDDNKVKKEGSAEMNSAEAKKQSIEGMVEQTVEV